ncbi:Mobile element protein [Treponema phagedenis]|uniref:Mobile element protein n=1 Tax=Treponema phagedenis TaxID=162 RepID=A0A0B7GSR1_TREPH|nr:integrase core domain-containing protein [Treponema phagedenis]CEM61488.1 Mobile element protein [Treponema phagedenis]
MKFEMRQPGAGVIVHSDAGSQFTSIAYKQTLGKFKAIQSMSDVGKCYDNARMESFFATLKKELLYRIDTTKMTREQVKTLVWQYTMVYYNRKRISTVNEDGLPPTFYRLKVTKKRWSGLNIHLGDKNTELILTFPV